VLIVLALVLIGITLTHNPKVAFARPRVSGDSTLTAIVLGVVALVGPQPSNSPTRCCSTLP
jgi:hypothetical protein